MGDTGRQSAGLSKLQFVVGFDGEVSKKNQKQMEIVEAKAKNGELQELLGVPVLGWTLKQVIYEMSLFEFCEVFWKCNDICCAT